MFITKSGFEFVFDPAVSGWVGERVGCEFGDCAAIGLLEGGRLICGVVYSHWMIGPENSVEMTIAAEGRWAHRRTLKVFFSYAFDNLNCRRVTAVMRSPGFLERLGFTHEGTLRKGYPNGDDMLVYGMLREECRWI